MPGREHHYSLTVVWTGNSGTGTSGYRAYSRNHEVNAVGKERPIQCSSDTVFRGERGGYSPEELLVASLSGCHMLWFLHLCANAGIVVTEYVDSPTGRMLEHEDGSGEFLSVTLRPRVTVVEAARIGELAAVHDAAHSLCFIARSVRFPVIHEPGARALSG